MEALAYAKINLSLRVRAVGVGGLHPIRGLFQSVDWSDRLRLAHADEDSVAGPSGGEVIDGVANLAWRAVTAVRAHVGDPSPLSLILRKSIPVAAGLGGGSADAAAGLALAGRILGSDTEALTGVASTLGSDVPFCLVGGKAIVGGHGERVDRLEGGDAYGLALVVPPVELSTAAVYRSWDQLEGPTGLSVEGRDLPPSLRDYGPLSNDLYPAAVATDPAVEEWRAELAALWDRVVLMTGSGPTLFAFFLDREEAEASLAVVPVGARATMASVPIDRGWQILDE